MILKSNDKNENGSFTKATILHYCISITYRCEKLSFVVSMLYLPNEKRPYTFDIQSFKFLIREPERTEVEPIYC